VQKLEDTIKVNIRKQLRDMVESRERFTVQVKSMKVAEKRVKSVTLFLEAGRAQIRDLTDAQEDLLDAQNGLTEAAVDYRLAELEFQRDTGLLKIDEKGLWQEYSQREIKHDKH
jgi:outer membrane protein TolC